LQHEFETATEDATGGLTMKSLCETRWTCRYEAVRAMQANLQVVVKLLDALIEEKSSEAKSLLMLEAYFSKFGVLNFF